MGNNTQQRRPRSLADDLRQRSPEQIRRLLELRPDLCDPWPADIADLAVRCSDDASVTDFLCTLDTEQLRILEVCVALTPTTVQAVNDGLGVDASRAMQHLWDAALLWAGPPDTGPVEVARAAQQAFHPFACGLGPPLADAERSVKELIADPSRVADLALEIDAEVLRTLVWDCPVWEQDLGTPLLVGRPHGWLLPREVSLILRNGQFLPQQLTPVWSPATDVRPGVDAWMAVAGVRYLLTYLAGVVLRWRTTGISAKASSDMAEAMRVPQADIVWWLELASAAGLIGVAEDRVGVTGAGRHWLSEPVIDQWTELARAWLSSQRPVERCVPSDLGLLTSRTVPSATLGRNQILQAWPVAAMSADTLTAAMSWLRPRLPIAAEMAAGVFEQAHRLGLAVAGQPTAVIELLLAQQAPDAEQLGLPDPAGSIIVQPDLSVIVTSPSDASTWQLLASVADLESWGPATVHRITPATIRRAIGHGWSADAILAGLTQRSTTQLPQALTYLISDAERSQDITVTAARSLVRTTDERAQEVLKSVGMVHVADGVFGGDIEPERVQEALTQAGFTAHAVPTDHDVDYAALPVSESMRRIGEVDRLAMMLCRPTVIDLAAPRSWRDSDPATLVEVLAEVAESNRALWIKDADGQEKIVQPVHVSGGVVTALVGGRIDKIPLARIAATGELAQ